MPTEILERILKCDSVSHLDLLAFSSACTRFQSVGSSQDVWRLKFMTCFSRLYSLVLPQVQARQGQHFNWKTELRKRVQIGQDVSSEISSMSPKLYHDTELSFSDFSWFDDLLLQHNPERSFVHLHTVDSLLELLAKGGREQEDLTIKYYTTKVLGHVQHRLLRGRLRELWPELESGQGQHSYEAALVMVAQWCQPCLDLQEAEVAAALDRLGERVLEHLVPSQPNLAIFRQIVLQQEQQVKKNPTQLPHVPAVFKDSLWQIDDIRSILQAANHVLYQIEGLQGNREDYSNPDNSYINKVLRLRKGIPISLCLVYCCVLKRLGVVTVPVNIPGHFLLKYLAHPEQDGESRFTYIDAFDGGKQLSYSSVKERMPHLVAGEDSYLVASPGLLLLLVLTDPT